MPRDMRKCRGRRFAAATKPFKRARKEMGRGMRKEAELTSFETPEMKKGKAFLKESRISTNS
jgi:hypothetical protein